MDEQLELEQEAQELERRKKQSRKARHCRKMVKRLLMTLVCVILAGTGLYFGGVLTPEKINDWYSTKITKSGGNGYPVKRVSGTVCDIKTLNGAPVLLTDSGIIVYNENGGEVRNSSHSFSFPALIISGDYALVYDKGAKNLEMGTKKETLYHNTLTQNIITADISCNGRFCVVTESASYACEVSVYNSTGDERAFYWCPTSDTVLSVALSDDGGSLCAATVNAAGGEIVTTIYYYKLNSEEPVFKKQYKGVLFASVFFTDDGIRAVGATETVCLDDNGKELSKKLISADAAAYGTDGLFAVRMGSDTVSVLDSDNKAVFTVTEQSEICMMDFSGDSLVVLTRDLISWYGADGKQKGKKEIPEGGIMMAASDGVVYVLTTSTIEKILVY